ncbi:MAG: hypothetical protein RMK52_07280 [Chitinophagales bacterium]|nr:hypothetical protein [Chitinophagales bacterium]MDW8394032.1 hypothetical protein [Chitinophagales bacterium]
MKSAAFRLLFLLLPAVVPATAKETGTPAADSLIALMEDSLAGLSDSMVLARDQLVRQNACYTFIPLLVRALRQPGSFDYPFSRLRSISILYPDDRSFRIFTWALRFDDFSYRYYGAIQMNQRDELKLFPLYDARALIRKLADTVTDHQRWPGAVYYKLKTITTPSGKTYHLLFGWDGHTAQSNRKVIEVLSFVKGKPVFGAALFDFGPQDSRNRIKRYIVEYKENAVVTLNYDPDLQMIITDHLQPEAPQLRGDYRYYVPDGTYEGFQWEGKKLRYVEQVFTSTQAEPPFERPVDFRKRKKWYDPQR